MSQFLKSEVLKEFSFLSQARLDIWMQFNDINFITSVRDWIIERIVNNYLKACADPEISLVHYCFDSKQVFSDLDSFVALRKIYQCSLDQPIKGLASLATYIETNKVVLKVERRGGKRNRAKETDAVPMYIQHQTWLLQRINEGVLEQYPFLAKQANLICEYSSAMADMYLYHQISLLDGICPACRHKEVKYVVGSSGYGRNKKKTRLESCQNCGKRYQSC